VKLGPTWPRDGQFSVFVRASVMLPGAA